ncbi:MAG: dienelactone hydrolase family protein [Phycisphaeraceae bacterium]|nr:dienelactone hydrolase family protein [Phycisphaeraceae bacterium]
MNMVSNLICFVMVVFGLTCQPLYALRETLPPLKNSIAPQTFEALWAGYDPRAEPLEIEILKAWEEDEVMLQVVRYRIGIFKGQKAMMAAVYGYPKGQKHLPGLVQIHGGGQYAHSNAVFTNAKRGYATISIAWAGRIDAPGYRVTPDVVKLFWDGKTDDPKYKLTTDWGALDAYHAPCRNPRNAFAHVRPQPWTLDDVDSPRNNPWFLVTLGARRALTFLEQQAQVNPEKLGVYGHSMGGKLTVLTVAADARVKAAAPSCGGLSDRSTGNVLYDATIADDVSLKHIACPIMFLSPSNDFHGRIDDLQKALKEIESKDWRVTCSPHHNHQDTPEYEVATQLWFDQTLKGTFSWPETPESSLELKTSKRVPSFSVTPDASRSTVSVDIYYTQQGQGEGEKHDRINTMNRFWRHVHAKQNGRTWTADLPLLGIDKPLWGYANVLYQGDNPVTGAGYYYGTYTTDQFNLSSTMHIATPEQLHSAGVQTTLEPSSMIETFEGDWEKEWFTYRPADWARRTHKLYDDQWKAPEHAKLAIEVRSEKANKLIIGIDQYAAEVQLTGNTQWQTIVLSPDNFQNAVGTALTDWTGLKELMLGAQETLREKVDGKDKRLSLGANWHGKEPQFRNLRWMTE